MDRRLSLSLASIAIICFSIASCSNTVTSEQTAIEIAIGQPCEIPSGGSRPITFTGRTPANADVTWAATAGSFDPATGLITTYLAPEVEEDTSIQLSVRVRTGELDFTEAADCLIKAPFVITVTPTIAPPVATVIPTSEREPIIVSTTTSEPEPIIVPAATNEPEPTIVPTATNKPTILPTSTRYQSLTPEIRRATATPISSSSFGNLKEMGLINIDMTTNLSRMVHFTWEWDGDLNDGEYLEVRAGQVGEPLKSVGVTTGLQESYYDAGLFEVNTEYHDCFDFQWQVVHMAADKQTAISQSELSDFDVCNTR